MINEKLANVKRVVSLSDVFCDLYVWLPKNHKEDVENLFRF